MGRSVVVGKTRSKLDDDGQGPIRHMLCLMGDMTASGQRPTNHHPPGNHRSATALPPDAMGRAARTSRPSAN